jgi:vitamin B12 transporter
VGVSKVKSFLYFFYFLLITSISKSDIPVIFISAGKALQSSSTIGSDIKKITQDEIEESNEIFLGDLLDKEITGVNFSRQGTIGTNSLIQLRGLPKRYTTIYIDGVKMSDPSTPDNSYYLNNLMTNSIESIEVLKGNQSSLYGSGAIGGTVNIFTKKPKNNQYEKNTVFSFGSHSSKNLGLSFDQKINNHEYYINLSKFQTDGISAMSDNDENDSYKNNGLNFFYGYHLTDDIKIENYLRSSDSLINYDQAGSDVNLNSSKDREVSFSTKIIKKDNKKKKEIAFNKSYFKRLTNNNTRTSKGKYYGYRDSINFLSEYNFNLDTRLIIGLENEFDAADFSTWATSGNKYSDEAIYSQYFDFQFRPYDKIYSTFGFRNDYHTTAGPYKSGRFTISYKPDGLTKFRGGLGNGIRFPTLNDYFYDINVIKKETLKPEKSYNIEFGYEKKVPNIGLDFSTSVFYTEYNDNISNWSQNTQSGNNYTIANSNGKIKSKGIETSTKFKLDKSLFLKLNYTFIDAYDGEDCDDPDSSCIDNMPVRVPRHALSGSLTKKINNSSISIYGKYNSDRRDYGNSNNNFKQVILGSYSVFDLNIKHKLFNQLPVFIKIKNIFNKQYQEAYQYSTDRRSYEIGFKSSF